MLFSVMARCTDPYYNLAMEEYLLSRVPEDGCILYLWQNHHTVVIGRNQNPWAECRVTLLEEEGGTLSRRLSGGGAVYHDLGNLNFTFLCREGSYDLQKQLSVIREAVSYAGIEAVFSGRNDLLVGQRKFSGNAFYHKKGAAYHHGTLLISSDLDKLQRYLSPPKAKLASKSIPSVRSRVVNLSELNPSLSTDMMASYMMQAFSSIYGENVTPLPLSQTDLDAIQKLRTIYAGEEWLYKKPIPFTCTMEGHFSFGHLQLQLFVQEGTVQTVNTFTDAMDAALPEKLEAALLGCPFQTGALSSAVSTLEIGSELSPFIQNQQL